MESRMFGRHYRSHPKNEHMKCEHCGNENGTIQPYLIGGYSHNQPTAKWKPEYRWSHQLCELKYASERAGRASTEQGGMHDHTATGG